MEDSTLTGTLLARHPALALPLAALFFAAPHSAPLASAGAALPLQRLGDLLSGCLDAEVLPAHLHRAVLKRQLDFIGGRLCAERALFELGVGRLAVGRDDGGAPRWPGACTGSITHTGGVAYALACRTRETYAIGIDSERLLDRAGLASVRAMCCTRAEIERYLGGDNALCAASLIFSAKEALYKAISATVGRFVDFTEVELAAIDYASQQLQFHGISADVADPVRRCAGHFRITNGQVHTTVLLRARDTN